MGADDPTAFVLELSRGPDYTNADCGAVETGNAMGSFRAVVENGRVEIDGHHDSEGGHVLLAIRTSRDDKSGLDVKTYLGSEEARAVAERLRAAADVAAGEGDPESE